MFTRSDLFSLMDATPELGASIFLPTHVRGAEIRQDPIRLKNLAAVARDKLEAAGLSRGQADDFLAPALALVEDYGFWQHQSHGLALFLDGTEARRYQLPIPLSEQVLVGMGFHVKPLLPALAADGAFHVLTITADQVRLFDASRFALSETSSDDLPEDLGEVTGESDYENPVQAAPVARPHTAGISIGNAQVYGDSPEDWRKGRLVEYVRRITSALEDRLAADAVPVVVVADAETGGHFRKLTNLGPLLAGVVETNPAAMDPVALHEAAYALVQPRFDADRQAARERFAALHGSGDARAVAGLGAVHEAAEQGRVDTLLLAEVAGPASAEEAADRNLLDAVATQTLRSGGKVYVLASGELPEDAPLAAILRY
jgi:hypothetical protein